MDLVIFAAGSGSRFGGPKQYEPVGPNDECLFEYSVSDAIQAGFNRFIFVIRRKANADFILSRLAAVPKHIEIEFAIQTINLSSHDSGTINTAERVKPWGTTHALLSASSNLRTSFAVINADDYYGPSAYERMVSYLTENKEAPEIAAMIGYKLANTLSLYGGVNRGICQSDEHDFLVSIMETNHIERVEDARIVGTDQSGTVSTLAANSIVSMNFWGFHIHQISTLEADFTGFLQDHISSTDAELQLPTTVNQMINDHRIRVKILSTNEQWYGLTYRQDLPNVKRFLTSMANTHPYTT